MIVIVGFYQFVNCLLNRISSITFTYIHSTTKELPEFRVNFSALLSCLRNECQHFLYGEFAIEFVACDEGKKKSHFTMYHNQLLMEITSHNVELTEKQDIAPHHK